MIIVNLIKCINSYLSETDNKQNKKKVEKIISGAKVDFEFK